MTRCEPAARGTDVKGFEMSAMTQAEKRTGGGLDRGAARLALVFVASFGTATSFYLLLSVVPGLPGREERAAERPVGVVVGLRTPALAWPVLVFAATTMAAGIVVTFLPLAVRGGRPTWSPRRSRRPAR